MNGAPASTRKMIQIAEPSLGEEEWLALREPLTTGWLTQGPVVARFERKFAELHSLSHALAVTSCTTGLHLALAAAGIGPGDEVIVPSFTWVATANAVLYCGATPVLVDVDPGTFNIDLESLRSKLSAKTRAVIPVHLFGFPAEILQIRQMVGPDVFILEDAACAAGARLGDRFVGALGDAASFSFHPRKSVTTGEGGMVTTASSLLAEKMQILRNHGASVSEEMRHLGSKPFLLPDFEVVGFNYRMTDLQAALGLVQLDKLERLVSERSRWAEWYRNELASISWLRCPKEPATGRHAWQSFVTLIDPDRAPKSRNAIMEDLFSRGVSTRPGTHAIHGLGVYAKRYRLSPQDFPGAQQCADQTMALPFHNKMSKEDFEWVVKQLREIDRGR